MSKAHTTWPFEDRQNLETMLLEQGESSEEIASLLPAL